MKSIKNKILVIFLTILIVAMYSVSSIQSFFNISGTFKTVEVIFEETAQATALSVSNKVTALENILKEIATIDKLSTSTTLVSEKKRILNNKLSEYGFMDLTIADKNGIDLNGDDVSSFDFFQQAITGNTYTSSPITTSDGKSSVMYIAAPIRKNGSYNSEIMGVLYATLNGNFLSEITSSIHVGEKGGVYILNKYGNMIANQDQNKVINQENNIELSKTNSSLSALAKLEEAGLNGEAKFGKVKLHGIKTFMYITPIDNTDGWVMGVHATVSDFLRYTYNGILIGLILSLVLITLSILALVKFTNKITKPIKEVESAIKKISNGNYDVEINNHSNDEIGNMSDSLRLMVKSTKEIIESTARNLEKMADGDFDITTDTKYVGIYKRIENSMYQISIKLSKAIGYIKNSSEQVSIGSDQVSAASQALSQGATEQASSIQELSATIAEISDKVKLNAINAEKANMLAEEAGQEVLLGNKHMKEMTKAMEEITLASNEIGKIISTINNIAFQTNILALNAAVEASHAGAAGKGFAVVAEEVRNLAQKSAEAAKNTTALIEKSITAVENGTLIVNKTADSLSNIVEKSNAVVQMINEITMASEEQSNAISQVTQGVEQISAVVQTNSATAEESAATSEELNTQATLLTQLVRNFKVKCVDK